MQKKLLGKIVLRKSSVAKLVTEPVQQLNAEELSIREMEKKWTIRDTTVQAHLITSLLKLFLVMLIASDNPHINNK